jgi:threonine aldolase
VHLRYDFASDNTSGMAPEALQAFIAANQGHAASYGADATTRRAADLIRGLLDVDADVHFVATGTAANGIALAAVCGSIDSILAHEHAHIRVAEAGAPAFFGHGVALLPLSGAGARIEPDALSEVLRRTYSSSQQAPAVLSLSNATELGTIYTSEALQLLTSTAREAGLALHLDGARLAHAAAAGFDPRALRSLNIDVVVVGGSKAGMPGSEALVVLNPRIAIKFQTRLKQSGHLWSKSRFLAAPWIGMLESDAWLRRAAHANDMARRLAQLTPFEIAHPVQTNAVFMRMTNAAHTQLREAGWATFRLADGTVRLMCSWLTDDAAVEEVSEALNRVWAAEQEAA